MSTSLDRAWELKINQHLERSLETLTELKDSLGIPPGELTATQVETLLSSPDGQQALEVLLFAVSVSRSSGAADYAERLLSLLEAKVPQYGLSDKGYFSYERGMRAFNVGDYYGALDFFSHWARLAQDPFQKLCALGNLLFCFENLGLDYQHTLSQANALRDSLRGKVDLSRIDGQFAACEVRHRLRQGKLSEATALARRAAPGSQSAYHQLWIESLPYYRGYRKATWKEIHDSVGEKLGLDHRSYRARTLQGFVHPTDNEMPKPSEIGDRLYLWVWGWLVDPKTMPLERIGPLLQRLQPLQTSHLLTAEDSYLLRNALSWIGLFDPVGEKKIHNYLAPLQFPQGITYELWSLEYLVIGYLRAIRDQQELDAGERLRYLRAHPLWESDDLDFRALLEQKAPTRMGALADRVRQLLEPLPLATPLVVDLGRFEITHSGNQKLVSEPVARALDLLVRHPSVRCEEFVQICFGLPHYDSTIHDPRLYSLLARIKKLSGNRIALKVRKGTVLCESSIERFVCIRHNESAGMLRFLADSAPPKKTRWTSQNLVWQGAQSREEIQQFFKKPRSTTNRLLTRLVNEGRVIREGQGRRTTYRSKEYQI